MAQTDKAARRAARALILQILYEVDVTHHDPAEALATHLEEAAFDPELETFVRQIVVGVLRQKEEVDGFLAKIAPEWPIGQMAPVDRNILRVAIYELLHLPETPLRVAINEAVELARKYGSESSHRFVNGALGTFAKQYLKRS